ncbi:Fanconi anemia group D2 protein-like [Stylophora pistillata]|uniref:Fanconi anemia group D2 protein-like n=1 Tax=Stylophora pistillata TaxID=50429 RepID=UPI000C0467B7|nr:Fanconi anemia group D2 protein-like [Stylophora pistillata]
MLLGIDILQPKIASMLLEKLPEFTEDDCNNGAGDFNIPRLVLNQFRWLDCVIQSKELAEKMLEIVGITSVEIQREIITCIPEVLDDAEHTEVARELSELLCQNTGLTVPILDALSNLNLHSDLLAEVRASVIQILPSAEISDLPVVVKFILQSVSDNDAFEVISELRANLDFTSTTLQPSACSTPAEQQRPSRGGSTSDGELFTLEAICSGIRFQKSVAEGWIKAIESVNSPVKHKVVDLFVLLILHSTANRKKAMESLIRNKIKNGHFTEEMLSAAFSSHSQILREYFPDLLSLAEILLRSPDPSVCSYACSTYKLSFVSFDLYCQQEVVGTLVTHIGSGFAAEADASLDVLSDLVESHADIMAPFAIFIKGLLDYLDNLTITQIRKLFSMLSTLAFANQQEGGLIQDDMHIVIRKQLSSNSAKYKRIGIIGAIMVVHSMAKKRSVNEGSEETMDSQSQPRTTLSNDVYKQICSMLEMIRNSTNQTPEAAALFYDELARIIQLGGIDPKIEAWISETVVADFQDDFLVDREQPTESVGVPMELSYALDEAEEGSIAVNILPLLLASRKGATSKEKLDSVPASLICLAPHFRLLRVCEESQHKGDLEGIDALLGCPLVSFKEEMIKEISSLDQADREVICGTLFHTVNWFREVVNAFASQESPELRGKSIARLQGITTLCAVLEKCLAATPTFKPPLATFDFEDSLVTSPHSNGNKSKAKKGKKTNKGSHTEKPDDSIEKIKDPETENANNKESETQKDSCKDTKEKEKDNEKSTTISMSQYQAFLRELDLKTFSILKCGLVSREVLDSEMNTEETTILQLQAPQLEFLLEDLSRKLQYSLSASASSRRNFLKVRQDKLVGFSNLSRHPAKEVAKYVVELLPVLCEHLEATSAFFQALVAQNDGLMDGPGYNTDEAHVMASCYHLLFNCLQTLFAWSGFVTSEHQNLFKKALFVLSSRIKLSSKSQPGFQALLEQSFHYLEQFQRSIPNITTAVSLTKLLVVLCERGRDVNNGMSISLAELTGNFLKREWLRPDGERESGAKYNEALQFLLRFHLSCAEDTLVTIEEVAGGAVTELIESEDKNAASTTYQTLTRSSLPCYYRAMMEELIGHLKQTHSVPLKKTDSPESHNERLVKLNISVRLFHILINLVKAFDQRSMIGASLKFGRLFVDTFLKLGMPVLDSMLRTHKDDINGMLKNLQQSTRSLQHICGHSKVTKDLSLTNHVPAVKKCLETFVFRVKAMLTLNKCHEAFWVGTLKNRDIHGQEIMSQQSAAEEPAEEEEENEEMEDDDDDDDDADKDNGDEDASNDGESKHEGGESYSESF